MAKEHLPQRDEFPTADAEAWRRLAEATLKGASFDDKLVSRTRDGLVVMPLHSVESARSAIEAAGSPGTAPFTRGSGPRATGVWTVAQRVDIPDPSTANAQVIADLEGGASGLVIVVDDGTGRGTRLDAFGDLDVLFDGVMLDLVAITIEAGAATRRSSALLMAWLAARGAPVGSLRLTLGFDPIGVAARTGQCVAPTVMGARLADTLSALRRAGLIGPQILVDGRIFAGAGASEAQELGFALASAAAYARLLVGADVSRADAIAAMAVKLTVDADQFLSIAKLRAMRGLWSRFAEVVGVAPGPLDLRAESAATMITTRDPWVNLLRTTVAAFAGAVGGADEVTLHPFTDALGVPDGFARRLARNTQSILAEESHLGRVADPAGGSAYVETLTQALAEKAWGVFQEIERAGGMIAALGAGKVQAMIAETRAGTDAAIARRKRPITGVSEFPNVAETTPAVLATPDVAASFPLQGGTIGAPKPDKGAWFEAFVGAARRGVPASGLVDAAPVGTTSIEPLPIHRPAAAFEGLRARADAHATKTGARATIFLATLGTPADFTARATFAKNLFEAGGIAAPETAGFATDEAMVDAFRASGAKVACLASSDAVYAARGETAARVLKAAGASTVILAGTGGDQKAALEAAGVDVFVRAGQDVVAVLGDLQARMSLVLP